MKVTIDRYRILHLVMLMICSYLLAEALIAKMEWTPLSAYGLACTITTQISNGINSQYNEDEANSPVEKRREDKRERVLEKRRERRTTGEAGKKKR